MDSLTFISNLIKSLTWPVVVLVIILIFKSEIKRKLASLIKAKHKNSEVLFEAEKAASMIEEATEDKTRTKGKAEEGDKIFINKIEIGLLGCCIASLLIPMCPLSKYARGRVHKSINSALNKMLEIVKERNPESPNMSYYEEILSLHRKQKFEE